MRRTIVTARLHQIDTRNIAPLTTLVQFLQVILAHPIIRIDKTNKLALRIRKNLINTSVPRSAQPAILLMDHDYATILLGILIAYFTALVGATVID